MITRRSLFGYAFMPAVVSGIESAHPTFGDVHLKHLARRLGVERANKTMGEVREAVDAIGAAAETNRA